MVKQLWREYINMSKYFTKWLPVEGEILPGDKFTHRLTDSKIHTNTDLTPIKHHPYYKKVKLFLCSRDIIVGDEIYLSETKEYHRFGGIKNNTIVCCPGNGIDEEHRMQDLFKVIGEVSPDSLSFVEEGMEFDKNVQMNIYEIADICVERNIPVEYLGKEGFSISGFSKSGNVTLKLNSEGKIECHQRYNEIDIIESFEDLACIALKWFNNYKNRSPFEHPDYYWRDVFVEYGWLKVKEEVKITYE